MIHKLFTFVSGLKYDHGKNRINKVYTKFGDAGNTMLVSGEIVSKDSIRVKVMGI